MKLFYVRADDEEGENLDLFVWAETHFSAAGLWAEYYGMDAGYAPDAVTEIPTTPPAAPGPIPWSDLLET